MSVGSTLKSKREASALSIRKVSDETNIQPWIIEALEDDSISERMNSFYARGFLHTYARFLQIPAESFLEEVPLGEPASDSILAPDDDDAIPVAWDIPYEKIARFAKPAAAVCVVVLIFWMNPLAMLSKLSFPSLNRPQVAAMGFAGKGALSEDLSALAFSSDEPLTLSINAKRPTWIQLWSDGKLLVQQKLESGESKQWKAESGFKVIVAKPANVDMQINKTTVNAALIGYQGRIEISHQGISRIAPQSG